MNAKSHDGAVDKVMREARRLAGLERSTWRGFLMVAYGELDPAHVRRLVDQARGDVRVLDHARRRILENTRDSSDMRACRLLRRAAIRALTAHPN